MRKLFYVTTETDFIEQPANIAAEEWGRTGGTWERL